MTRFFEGAGAARLSPAETDESFPGYLADDSIDFKAVVAPAPAQGSPQDRDDVLVLRRAVARADEPRWRTAQADDASVFDRFSAAMGVPVDRQHLPRLVHLLRRIERDVREPTFAAKEHYLRSRPYQRFQLRRVCGEAVAPEPEPRPADRSSYPSGHSSYGWATALIMAEVAPAQAQALLARGNEYGESRVICGMHFPSDVEAGRLIATAVVERLHASPEFLQDLHCAKMEYRVVLAGRGLRASSECLRV